jgi:hypothetical protein
VPLVACGITLLLGGLRSRWLADPAPVQESA